MTASEQLPRPRTYGDVEVVHASERQMFTGVAVSDDGRTFVRYPHWATMSRRDDTRSHPPHAPSERRQVYPPKYAPDAIAEIV